MKNQHPTISATQPQNRLISLDILRGVALLGIAIVNVLGFNSSFFDFGGFYRMLPDAQEQTFYQLLIRLSADKFIFLFSFLYGYGIYMQLARFTKNQWAFTPFFARRMLVLALFGVLHVVFLWAGDILLPYAIAGMILIGLRKLPDWLLLVVGLFIYFFVVGWLLVSVWIPLPDGLSSSCTECLGQALDVYSAGNYWQILQLRMVEYTAFIPVNLIYYLPKILGISIFGFLASKHKLHAAIANKQLLWGIATLLISAVAVVTFLHYESWVAELVGKNREFLTMGYILSYEIVNLFVASSYALIILWLTSFDKIQWVFKPLSYPGRMSLTNYLLQSLFFGFVFYGWGLGFFGWQRPTQIELLALFIFLVEIIFSYFWLKEFKQGPLESLWRKLSYRKW